VLINRKIKSKITLQVTLEIMVLANKYSLMFSVFVSVAKVFLRPQFVAINIGVVIPMARA